MLLQSLTKRPTALWLPPSLRLLNATVFAFQVCNQPRYWRPYSDGSAAVLAFLLARSISSVRRRISELTQVSTTSPNASTQAWRVQVMMLWARMSRATRSLPPPPGTPARTGPILVSHKAAWPVWRWRGGAPLLNCRRILDPSARCG